MLIKISSRALLGLLQPEYCKKYAQQYCELEVCTVPVVRYFVFGNEQFIQQVVVVGLHQFSCFHFEAIDLLFKAKGGSLLFDTFVNYVPGIFNLTKRTLLIHINWEDNCSLYFTMV